MEVTSPGNVVGLVNYTFHKFEAAADMSRRLVNDESDTISQLER